MNRSIFPHKPSRENEAGLPLNLECFSTALKWIYFLTVHRSLHSRTLRPTEHDVRVTGGVWERNQAHGKGSLSVTELIHRGVSEVYAPLYALIT